MKLSPLTSQCRQNVFRPYAVFFRNPRNYEVFRQEPLLDIAEYGLGSKRLVEAIENFRVDRLAARFRLARDPALKVSRHPDLHINRTWFLRHSFPRTLWH